MRRPPARRRHRATAGVAAVGLAMVLAACSGSSGAPALGTSGDPTPAGQDLSAYEDLRARMSSDGRAVVVGNPKAEHTAKVYEDPRCSYCVKFETSGGRALTKAASEGLLKIEYIIASFLDRDGSGGSVRTASAMRAAVDAGKFPAFHAAVFTDPPERPDGYTSDFLLKTADSVPGLRSASFDAAVKDLKHKDWVAVSQQAFEESGKQGTPALELNGTEVEPALLYDVGAMTDKLTEVTR